LRIEEYFFRGIKMEPMTLIFGVMLVFLDFGADILQVGGAEMIQYK